MVKQKTLIDEKDNQGCTPLILAAVYNNSVCVHHLLEGKADVSITDNQGQNVLHKAAKEGNKDVLKTIQDFLKKKDSYKEDMKKLMSEKDVMGNTPLILALESVITGKTLKFLLDIDRDLELNLISQNNKIKDTPMHRACRYMNYGNLTFFQKLSFSPSANLQRESAKESKVSIV